METQELTKVQLADLIDAVNYMKLTDWTKYKQDGNRSGERIHNDEARCRRNHLLTKLYDIKSTQAEREYDAVIDRYVQL